MEGDILSFAKNVVEEITIKDNFLFGFIEGESRFQSFLKDLDTLTSGFVKHTSHINATALSKYTKSSFWF